MAFFGITCLGYQEPIKSRTLQSCRGVSYYRGDEKREGSDSKLPPIHRTSSTALHKGSQERYKEMIKRVQMPNSPNQIYRVPLTSGQQYGWWMPRANQTAIEKTVPWTRITRQPRLNSEMTRFVDQMTLTNREFSLF
ncbi:testis-expressed protein 49-like [Acipenser oxyrinchus oxyrinchus]|uniref:Testis-expressed protein 49-like n=1 Tax=Acipenser oxyrinchus oxyrinchus TaxID=40147 RepID=A0AAD8CGK8_ACIOX|nr:testis-expressed protein 49-like [Acipenser oxyrinchus oxyrinchus]KAK1151319.1 testis-expressed protein 49-like [Acipenser oxyrinchus oxyrinchus]